MATVGAAADQIAENERMDWPLDHRCTCNDDDAKYMRKTLKYTKGIRMYPLEPNQDLHELGPNRMVIWKQHIAGGLRVPPPSFLQKICTYFQIPLTQINPSALRRALAFHIIVTANGYEDSAELFFQTQTIRAINRFYVFQSHPSHGIKFLETPPSLEKNFSEKFQILALNKGTIQSVYGLPQNELHRVRHYVTRDQPIVLPPHVRDFIAAINRACRQKNGKPKPPSVARMTNSIDALVATGLFTRETQRIGKFDFPTHP